MYILGINSASHDGSAALLKDGQLLCMIEQERLSRKKRALNEWPTDAIISCLEWAGITLDEVEAMAFGWDIPKKRAIRNLPYNEKEFLGMVIPKDRVPRTHTPPLYFVPHHLAHASSAFWTSSLEQATILVIDGQGESESTTIAKGTPAGIELRDTWDIAQSLGTFYEEGASWAGFTHWDAGKLMGLAPYGLPNQTTPLTTTHYGYRFADFTSPDEERIQQKAQQKFLRDYFKQNNYPFSQGDKTEVMAYSNFAASVQRSLEEVVLQLIRVACQETGCNDLILVGGVAMNCTLNGRIARSKLVNDFYIPPVPFDAGVSLGAALVVDHKLHPNRSIMPRMHHAYWAPPNSQQEISVAIQATGMHAHQLTDRELISRIVTHLESGHLVGWFQGRAEVGQRALGARSILGDPRNRANLPRINALKGREIWRPLAPSILEDSIGDLFGINLSDPSDFMLAAYNIRRDMQRLLPAVVHIDESTRPQVVHRETNTIFWDLLFAFRQTTGIPALINTSFNLAGEPIVYSPDDAISTFSRSELDVLVMDNFVIEKCD
ncbi:nodulation protein NolNO [Reticulibacter mediterranei]|uniref:Nodulation protein NolNO n=1 Tax=Reticulibacter mediterranei TaxID=2778369 RepID=A0A8J3N3W1_9CHLR|nr:carbamoyltransferase C-terminal domain-containing protein [Reticulibacter mediterranei]GHO97477.1 nodulation protein NolNO [Reticulibacter mediterranei]